MTIWILAIALLVIFGALGFAQGAIRTIISFVGVLIGLMFAVPLGHALKPLMATIGIKNPVYQVIFPPVIVFVLIYLIISGLSFYAHHKVYLTYKYKRDDLDRLRWERMNRMIGSTIGVLTGAVLFFLLSGVIYAAGYLTVQLSAEDNNPATIKFVNSVRQDMTQTGFDKTAAHFDPAPKIYYQTADVLGLIYHNPLLQSRLTTYPYFLTLSQRPEFQEIATDKEYNDLIFGKAPVTQIIDSPRTQTLLNDQELLDYLKGTDIKDLKTYLKTGKSPKYDAQEILGVWDLDRNAILTQVRKANLDIKARELRVLKERLEKIPPISLMATPDNKIIIKSEIPTAPPADAALAAPPDQPQIPDRYRRTPPPAAQAPKPAAPPEPAGIVLPLLTGEGTWKEEVGQYVLTASDPKGKPVTVTASVRGDEMVLHTPGVSLVFSKE
jgi:hypothetical protein